MTLDEIKIKLWDEYSKSGNEITRGTVNLLEDIPNHRKCHRMGLNLYDLNKEFKLKYITEVNITCCLTCNNIITVVGNKFCNTSCAASFNNKNRKMSSETKNKISNKLKGNIPQNKGNCSKIDRKCLICDSIFMVYANGAKIYCSRKCNPKLGGYREGAGYSKSGYYKGIYYGSTYELVWGIYRIDHGLTVKRFDGYIEENGKKYFPDFDVDGKIIEIKGRHTKEVDIKTNMAIDAGYQIEVKYKKDLQKEFEWVKKNYTYKEIYELYDGYNPKYEYVCDTCGEKYTSNKIKTRKTYMVCSRKCNRPLKSGL